MFLFPFLLFCLFVLHYCPSLSLLSCSSASPFHSGCCRFQAALSCTAVNLSFQSYIPVSSQRICNDRKSRKTQKQKQCWQSFRCRNLIERVLATTCSQRCRTLSVFATFEIQQIAMYSCRWEWCGSALGWRVQWTRRPSGGSVLGWVGPRLWRPLGPGRCPGRVQTAGVPVSVFVVCVLMINNIQIISQQLQLADFRKCRFLKTLTCIELLPTSFPCFYFLWFWLVSTISFLQRCSASF